MEVMVEVPSIPAYVSGTALDKRMEKEEGRGGVAVGRFSGLSGSGERTVGSEKPEASSESSSLGYPTDEEEEEEEEEDVVSSSGGGDNEVVGPAGAVFGSLSSLEDSLPIKRGLSNCFTGKSKSFANLSEVTSVHDLQKEDNPLNKRRRTLIAYKLSKKNSGIYSWQNPNSMPLLAVLKEEQNQENNLSEEDEDEDRQQNLHGRRIKTFKSTSCFSLADL